MGVIDEQVKLKNPIKKYRCFVKKTSTKEEKVLTKKEIVDILFNEDEKGNKNG